LITEVGGFLETLYVILYMELSKSKLLSSEGVPALGCW
jgi:hypothetical protein